MSGTLDAAFATAQADGLTVDAYTDGTAAALTLQADLLAIQASLQAGAVQADAAVTGADLTVSAGLTALCDAAAYQAQAYAALAELTPVLDDLL